MATGRPIFHHLSQSQSLKVLWLLEELNIDYDLQLHERVASGKNAGRAPPELQKTHPLGKSPQLVTAEGRVIVESDVIAKYLINTYDTKKQFQGDPATGNDDIRNDTLCCFSIASLPVQMHMYMILEIMAARSPFFVRFVFNGARSMFWSMFAEAEFEKSFGWLESELADQDYFMGSNPGRADFMLSWPVDFCTQRKYVDLKKYPKLEQWYERCHAREGWKRAKSKANDYTLTF